MAFIEALKPGAKVCLVGIGGISMSSLAFALAHRGCTVWGSDRARNNMTDRLEEAGIRVVHEHRGDTAEGADAVVRTAAVHDDNPEICRARALGIPVLERAEAWGAIMRDYRDVHCRVSRKEHRHRHLHPYRAAGGAGPLCDDRRGAAGHRRQLPHRKRGSLRGGGLRVLRFFQ